MSHIKVIPLSLLREHFTNKKKRENVGLGGLCCFVCCQITTIICFQASVEKWVKKCDRGPLLLSSCFQAPPSPLCWIVHLTTSISASALILASQLLVFTWSIQVTYLYCVQLYLLHTLYIHNGDWNFYNHFYFAFLISYWVGIMSRATDSKLWNKTRRQIYGGRRRTVFMWTRILSSGKNTNYIWICCLFFLHRFILTTEGLGLGLRGIGE